MGREAAAEDFRSLDDLRNLPARGKFGKSRWKSERFHHDGLWHNSLRSYVTVVRRNRPSIGIGSVTA